MNSFSRPRKLIAAAVLLSVLAAPVSVMAEELQPLQLPPPRMDGGKPLMQALQQRQSKREFSAEPLELQVLSDLLWAAFGINRPDIDHRTAPSAMNSQEIDVYVALAHGVFVYDAKAHALKPIAAGDVRTKTGGQDFVKIAPVALVFVADLARMVKARPETKEGYAGIDTGYISQNVYLYCASAGLATVAHELGDRRVLGDALQLRPDQKIILAQTVGYPAARRSGAK
ncbi:MAG: SagB/ThcOx family dehydrogenase [Opitutaceae bacterium]|nr:SagB/ThcOx family dehydrogenase [Opitutaceae bacterium]